MMNAARKATGAIFSVFDLSVCWVSELYIVYIQLIILMQHTYFTEIYFESNFQGKGKLDRKSSDGTNMFQI